MSEVGSGRLAVGGRSWRDTSSRRACGTSAARIAGAFIARTPHADFRTPTSSQLLAASASRFRLGRRSPPSRPSSCASMFQRGSRPGAHARLYAVMAEQVEACLRYSGIASRACRTACASRGRTPHARSRPRRTPGRPWRQTPHDPTRRSAACGRPRGGCSRGAACHRPSRRTCRSPARSPRRACPPWRRCRTGRPASWFRHRRRTWPRSCRASRRSARHMNERQAGPAPRPSTG